eukprot:TRINITY_DN112_c0_g1_i12.p7 TRINITY_DN112_c0_g1~~TRINITY_DN112_c0_g1_i12.p7  ORF type:complete len:102 (-),score=6.11 TRINITY_DN112_c0_g1_i12:2679-2984(-)
MNLRLKKLVAINIQFAYEKKKFILITTHLLCRIIHQNDLNRIAFLIIQLISRCLASNMYQFTWFVSLSQIQKVRITKKKMNPLKKSLFHFNFFCEFQSKVA